MEQENGEKTPEAEADSEKPSDDADSGVKRKNEEESSEVSEVSPKKAKVEEEKEKEVKEADKPIEEATPVVESCA